MLVWSSIVSQRAALRQTMQRHQVVWGREREAGAVGADGRLGVVPGSGNHGTSGSIFGGSAFPCESMELKRCTTTVLLAPPGIGSATKGSLKDPTAAVAPHDSLMSL